MSVTIHLLTQCFVSVFYHCDYFNTNMSCGFPLVDPSFYRGIPQNFVYIVKATYPWYNCDFAPKITGINPHVVIL